MPTKSLPDRVSLTIRRATDGDAAALAELAALDEARPPAGDVLLAVVGDELWAAVSVDDFHAVANPFRPSGELTFQLIERARQLRLAQRPRRRLLRRLAPVH